MRTLITSLTISTLAGAAVFAGAGMASATEPDHYDYATGAVGERCHYDTGKLALSRYSGIVLTCTSAGTWQIPRNSGD